MDRDLRHSVTASSVHCLGIGCVLALCYLLLHDLRNLSGSWRTAFAVGDQERFAVRLSFTRVGNDRPPGESRATVVLCEQQS